jgi:hypothetical protein
MPRGGIRGLPGGRWRPTCVGSADSLIAPKPRQGFLPKNFFLTTLLISPGTSTKPGWKRHCQTSLCRRELCAYRFLIMATMTIRTTVAFDPATVARWERLSKRWGVSKSEALRRALEAADQKMPPIPLEEEPDFTGMAPTQILEWISAHPLLPAGSGDHWSAEIRAEREAEAARHGTRQVDREASK